MGSDLGSGHRPDRLLPRTPVGLMSVLSLVPDQTVAGPSVDWIVAEYYERHARRGPVIAQMEALRDHYNGDIVTPLPEMDRADKAVTANLIKQGLDQTAMRISSVLPMLDCPPLNPNGKISVAKAEIRRKALLGWWEANNFDQKMRRRARYLVGYGIAPVLIRPWLGAIPAEDRHIPEWVTLDPLTCFPASSENPDDLRPVNNIRAYTRSVAYVRHTWPDLYDQLLRRTDQGDDERLTLLEYNDAEVTVTVVLSEQAGPSVINDGPAHRGRPDGMTPLTTSVGSFGGVTGKQRLAGTESVLELDRFPNLAGTCTVVMPHQVTLDRLMGQFDGLLPMYAMQARLQALEVIAVEKAIFPDAYLISRPDRQAEFVSGPHDGRTGLVNIVRDGEIKYENQTPGIQTNTTIDRLERNQRVSGNVASEYGGESPTNVRTGRRGEAVLSAQVDFVVQEAQEVFASSLREELVIGQKVTKAYFGARKQSFYVAWKGATGWVDYTPNKDFESDHCVVTYPHAGSDAAALVIGIGQRLNLGTMSKETARWLDPEIADPRREQHLVNAEALEDALKQSLLQQASQGQIPPADIARIRTLMLAGDSLMDAVTKVHEEAQKRQAADAAAAPGAPEAPVDPNSPEAQPGLALPGAGAEAGVSAPPNQGLGNFSQALNDLRRPNRLSPAERTG